MSCLLKYDRLYNKKEIGEQTSSSSQQLGKYIHKILEDYREGLDINELAKLYESKYVIAEEEKKVIAPMLETAMQFYEPYAGLPYESELNLKHVIVDENGGFEDIQLKGVVDKLYYRPDGTAAIIDFKTGKVKADNSLQLKFYTYLINKNKGIDPSKVESKIFYLRLKQTVPYTFTAEDIKEFENFITLMAEQIQHTGKFKHNFGYWCSFCEFRNTCEPFKARKELFGMRSSGNKTNK